jgi:P27 family predicted phage terminase small subunit
MRGRKSDPQAVKDAKGNPGRRKRHEYAACESDNGKISAHDRLSDRARKVWDTLSARLERLNFLRETDREVFARYCTYVAQWWDLTDEIKGAGLTYWTESAHGKMRRVAPEFLVRERIENRLEALEDRLGLNPQARQQMLMRLANIQALPPGGLFDKSNDGTSETKHHAPEGGSRQESARPGFLN